MADLRTTFVLLALATTAFVPALAAAHDAPEPGDFVVGFHALPDEARAGAYGNERVERVDDVLNFAVVHAADARGFQERAAHDPNVRYVQREQYATGDATPNDPYYAQQFAWARVNAPAAWDLTTGSTGVTVAVVDTGVERTHSDLAGSRLLPGYDFMNGDSDPSDDCGHGTGVAGVIGASTNNGLGVAGAAQVNVMPLKALGMNPDGKCYGPFSAVASSIRYAVDHGARVVSMSLGCVGCYDQATNDAIEYAWSKGALLVGSAGNNGPCTNCVSWPAAQPRVIAVACTDSGNAQCYFSSTGPEVEIAAPGKSIYTTIRGNAYGAMSGTSLSAPHVSGALGLALSVNPTMTNVDLRSKLASTAKDLGNAGRDETYGNGLLDVGALVAAAKASGGAPAPNQAPAASFTASASGLTANVDASASTDADGSIASYQWTWGDGLGYNSGTCATAGHAYAAAGTYTVTLTVTDNAGATSTATRTVTVSAPNQAPVASFTTSSADLSVTVDAGASYDPDGSVATYAWTYGDGATGAGRTGAHAYAAAGTYTVTLKVTDNAGATTTATRSVTVTAPAAAQPAPADHVGDLTGSVKKSGNGERLTWSVLIVDASGRALSGATVQATVTLPSGATTTLTATTSSTGVATFRVDAGKAAGQTYTLCVSNVLLSGWTYDAGANVVTCRSVTTL